MKPISHHLDAGLQNTARAITTQVLKIRDGLPAAANNRSPVPTDPYALYIHREMIAGRSVCVAHLLSILFAGVDDGASFADVMAPLRMIEHAVELRAVSQSEKRERQGQVIPLWTRAARKRGPFDVAAIKVGCALADGVVTPDEVPAIADAVEKGRDALEATEEYVGALETTLAIHTAQTPARRLEIAR